MLNSVHSSFFLPRLRIRHSPSGTRISSPGLPRDVIIASIFANLLSLAMPLAILQVYDRVVPNTATDTLLVLMLGVVGVLIADAFIKVARAVVVGRLGASFNHQAHAELFRRVLDADPSLFAKTPVSVQVHQLRSLQSIADHYGDQARLLAIDLPAGGIFLAVLAFIAGPLALVPVCLLGAFMFFALRRNRVLQQVVADRADQDDRKSDFILEVLSGAKTVKSQAMEALIMRRFERLQKAAAKLSARYMRLSGQARDASALFGTLTTVFVVLFGAMMVINGGFSIGGVAASTLLSGQFVQPFLRAINQLTDMQRLRHDYQQVNDLFQLPPVRHQEALPFETDGSLNLVNVSVELGEGRRKVFSDVNLTVASGRFVGFRGADGSGKSTLMKLLTGELLPTTGKVMIGGQDYDGPYEHALRKTVAYVDNQPAIFNGSILENITMFGAVSDIAHARMAAKLIGLEKEIHLLPKGYETQLGSDLGGKVPSATLQRICIARALAGEPRILILDEANAQLDQQAEKALTDALQRLKGFLTVVIISHRPSMLAVADQQYEIRDGRIHALAGMKAPDRSAKAGATA
ncbi:peptidase domain-containing ABC transporter [Roseibium salinum]|uniref:ABC transporter transmembrane domain-containing protein n=2 Tax=Roseibium salinum TaxID=1604349 RepID=A0ABT3R0S4_9HYPH|nr:ABC transporter transmembrane domain-containing protein [Roseibium sp. DSM 29163]